ncbi:MAG: hypothetical protein KHZ95_05250 [Eubacterium sp.]|nr:hypothetical protein [Eubacterium sp.]
MNNNYNITYPSGTDYYDINVFNNNFSKLADAVDSVRSSGYQGDIIVAAYNSTNPLKNYAHFTCTQGDCSNILNSALSKVNAGGRIILLDGDFYLTNIWTINKKVHITGMGKFYTTFNKRDDNIQAQLIKTTANEILIENIGFKTNPNTSNSNIISIGSNKVEINSCYFYITYTGSGDSACPIHFSYQFAYTAIRNCLIEKYKDNRYIVRAENSQWRGIMTGNFVTNISDNSQLAVAVNLMNQTSKDQIDFSGQKTAIYIKGSLVN